MNRRIDWNSVRYGWAAGMSVAMCVKPDELSWQGWLSFEAVFCFVLLYCMAAVSWRVGNSKGDER